ncbi:MAG: biopolymer transporter ExbD [Xanthomonadaceae bacterium]|nr:biopolymer transporter ExbD [Xanthomonadaceae bacterium]
MNLRPLRREEPEVNLTALIDVVFLLLIFFMVSTTFQRESELKIELPEASGEVVEAPVEALEIIIDAQGRYFLKGEQVLNEELPTLRRAIQKALGEQKEPPVIIRADARTPHQAVVRAMDAASQLGLVRISLATSQSHEGE